MEENQQLCIIICKICIILYGISSRKLEKMLSDKGKKSQTSKYLKGDYKKGENQHFLG